jgi:hypothetical protein
MIESLVQINFMVDRNSVFKLQMLWNYNYIFVMLLCE